MINKTKIFPITKNVKTEKSIALSVVSTENLKTVNYHTFLQKHLVTSIICNK